MTREVIAVEGILTGHNWYIEPGALTWDEEKKPLLWAFNSGREPLGVVSDIRREDGEITAEIEVFEDALPGVKPGDIEYTISLRPVSHTVEDNVKYHIFGGVIKSVSAVMATKIWRLS